jgi:hypothetical protein
MPEVIASCAMMFLMFAIMSDVMQSLVDALATGLTAKGIEAANPSNSYPTPSRTAPHRRRGR